MKNTNGITLIALVITIIVLLILAGISISMLSGENSILNKASISTQSTKESEIQEKMRLAYSAALTNGNGGITEELFVEELTKEFGTRNEKYTLINSKDGKSWTVAVNGSTIKENFLKPANLQTEPINPEEEYGYAGKLGVVDANTLVEGDIINYYYDKDKEPISCAVLYNDNIHGLEVVTLNSVKNITLGGDSNNIEPKAEDAFRNGTPEGYYHDFSNTVLEKNRWSYNHAFQILKEYAMDYIGNMAINARSIGAPDDAILEDRKNTNLVSFSENYECFIRYNNFFKNEDEWNLSEDIGKMNSLGILKSQNSTKYWIASRKNEFTDTSAGTMIDILLNYVNQDGEIDIINISTIGYDKSNNKYIFSYVGQSFRF